MNLLDKVYQAGVIGAGGAGFPTHIKLDCNAQYLIVNAAECEPLLQTDQYLMKSKSKEIITTIEKIADLIGASKLVIGVKRKYKDEVASLQKVINQLNSKVELFLLDNFYPAGDEQIMVYEITGRTIPPDGIPLNVGAVVSNVGTIVNICEALKDRAVTKRHISVLGAVAKPTLLQVPIGTSLARCIERAGGSSLDNYSVILGGPMMGKIINQENLTKEVVKKTDGAIIVIPKDDYIIRRNSQSIEHIINQAKSVCVQCSYCTQFCPRYLIGHPLHPHKIMNAIAFFKDIKREVFKEALLCCECGVCELYACPMGLSPRQINSYLKDKLAQQGVRFEREDREYQANKMREYRKIPINRLISRINLNQYQNQKLDSIQKLKVSQVKIPLNQHIGTSAEAIVSVGDLVEVGQVIGRVKRSDLGANIHASISGKVVEITDSIVISTETEVVL